MRYTFFVCLVGKIKEREQDGAKEERQHVMRDDAVAWMYTHDPTRCENTPPPLRALRNSPWRQVLLFFFPTFSPYLAEHTTPYLLSNSFAIPLHHIPIPYRIVTVPYRTVPHRSQPHRPGGGGSRNAGSTRHELNRHFLHPTKTETKNSLPAPRQSFLPPSLFGFALLDWSLIEVGCSIGPRYL